jgi:DNA-binding XRE family transcriptional regulator
MTITKIGYKRLANAVERCRIADTDAAAAKRVLIACVRNLNADGVSEAELARLVGVQRQTIRAWVGK